MKTTARARIAALAALAALGLTGCEGGSQAADPTDPTPIGSVATSAPGPVPTSTATATPPSQSSARAAQEAAAIALVRTYVDEYNKALQSGSTAAFRETFKETCSMCLRNATILDELFRTNQRIRGLESTVASPHVVLHDNRRIWVEGQLSQAGGKVLAASGAVVHNITPTRAFRFNWRVTPGISPVIFGSDL